MGFADMFSAEDRVTVKFSDFYELVKGCTEREVATNGLRYHIPHSHILAMLGELSDTLCKDCAHSTQNENGLFCLFSQHLTPPDGFCYRAVRKDGNKNEL